MAIAGYTCGHFELCKFEIEVAFFGEKAGNYL